MNTPLTPGQIIKNIRLEKGYTIGQIAKWSKVDKAELSKYENGKVRIRSDVLDKISFALKVSPVLIYIIWIKEHYFSDLDQNNEKIKLLKDIENQLKKSSNN
ncbi:MAG: helix-turn-helix domain-containing protein [Candidatus Nanoarchaeia archaeon]